MATGLSQTALGQDARNTVWVIPIDADISPGLSAFVINRIDRANEAQPLALVFEINTPGGQVSAMNTIVDAILTRAQVPTIAVVENAFSAGALIAMSADSLAMLPGSSIGAALPITVSPLGSASPVDEKMSSALRGRFRSVAIAKGRNPNVAEAMVDPRREIPGLATADELVTLTGSQAVEFDIADIEARNLRDALDQLGYAGINIELQTPTAAERASRFLTSPFVAAALLAIGVIGILIEIFTPGLGIPGILGVVALLLFFSGAFIANTAGALEFLIILAGIGLLVAEILVLPGFGIAGILGIAALVFGTYLMFDENTLTVLGLTTLIGGALLAFAFWAFPNTRLSSPFILRTRLDSSPDILRTRLESGPDSEGSAISASEDLGNIRLHTGQRGTATSYLRPAGVARFGPLRVDVVTEGDYVSAGSEIEVLRVEGRRVTVRAVETS
ncbi:MAG: ATP-dependent Clp protease proteolytic subunit [Deinococcota bacterium]|nr:ATP-dependent Clp protease proteolytic subunit [Deinococcota bacterium]